MCDQQLTIDLNGTTCVVKPITAKEYHDFSQKSLPISENYGFYMQL